MISLRRTITWPKRRWRAGGFGIHSPFAFSFVTGVLARKGAGDKEQELRAIAGSDFSHAALLYRCIGHFKPERIALCPADDETLTQIVMLACPEAVITDYDCPTPPDMTIVEPTAASTLRDNGSEVYIISHIEKEPPRSLWKRLTGECTRGMDFSDRRTGIICRFRHLPRQSFKIVFK